MATDLSLQCRLVTRGQSCVTPCASKIVFSDLEKNPCSSLVYCVAF